MRKSPLRKLSQRRRQQIIEETRLRAQLLQRCGGLCEICGKLPDWRGLSLSHENPKRMGGTTHVYTLDEVKMRCGICHDLAGGIIDK